MTILIRSDQRFALLVTSQEFVLFKPQITRLFLRIAPLRFEMIFSTVFSNE